MERNANDFSTSLCFNSSVREVINDVTTGYDYDAVQQRVNELWE